MWHGCWSADSSSESRLRGSVPGESPCTESREASQVQVIGDAVDELNGDLPVFMGGQHLGGQRELGVNPQSLLAELDDEREPSRLDGHLGLGRVLEQFRPNGYGTRCWDDKGKYEGNWKDGLRNGEGSCSWSDGKRYKGTWKEGRQNGSGKYEWPDGAEYKKMWKDGVESVSGEQ